MAWVATSYSEYKLPMIILVIYTPATPSTMQRSSLKLIAALNNLINDQATLSRTVIKLGILCNLLIPKN